MKARNGEARGDTAAMFDRIAPRYDLLNRLLSFRRDVAWRRRLAGALPEGGALRVLDLATGTGDVLLEVAHACPGMRLGVGLDPAGAMLERARPKIADHARLRLVRGDAMRIPAADSSFDAVTIAFGIRNVSGVETALAEMYRVLRPGGRVLILEFSLPGNVVLRAAYLLYFRHVLPRIGGLVSGDPAAYRYLNTSVETFPYGEAFCRLLRDAGFTEVRAFPLSGGIAALYRADKEA
ncbi:MAG: demethylmenaquinone methyltransferase / 2-methoxy-6-polyprenyl,4-benzoquinol methylase [Candidatus Hydrogenedentes bacterium]|nr:demethylmenaquinone methyltransferase / 2-methoxy-6-polyprenyl,4-benzoquinol methylase [Candidatus Hydrogenedentota bacterium]